MPPSEIISPRIDNTKIDQLSAIISLKKVFPSGCIHSMAQHSIKGCKVKKRVKWLNKKRKKWANLLLTGFCLAEACKNMPYKLRAKGVFVRVTISKRYLLKSYFFIHSSEGDEKHKLYFSMCIVQLTTTHTPSLASHIFIFNTLLLFRRPQVC